MTIKATLIKREYPFYNRPPYSMAEFREEEVEIEAESEDALLAKFFREYDNRYKYCNDISFRFKDEAWRERYTAWFADVNNYASNGGDMW